MTMKTNIKLLKAGFTIIRRQEYPTICIKKCEYKNGSLVWTMLEKNFESIAARERRMKELLKDSKFIDEPGENAEYLESYEYSTKSSKNMPVLRLIYELDSYQSRKRHKLHWDAELTVGVHTFAPDVFFIDVDGCINWAARELKDKCFGNKAMTVQIYEKTEQKTIPIEKEMKS